jgi:hypothetical protein
MSLNNDMTLDIMLGTKKCAKCGKEFFATPSHVYKERVGKNPRKWYCSWTCFNHRKEPKKFANCQKVEQLTLDGKSVKIFQSATNAHDCTGFKYEGIRQACKEHTPFKGYLWRYVEE